MNLGKYIQQLLPENETVIIPGFGAFITDYKPAEINAESDEISPPSKVVHFNPKIKNNDGVLAALVARNEQIPVQEAFKKIEEEREEIYSQLDKGEKVVIEGLGILFYDESHKIQFEYSGEINLQPDAFGLDKISVNDEPEDAAEEKPKDLSAVGIPEKEEDLPENATEMPETKKEVESFATFQPADPQFKESSKKKKRGWLWFLLLLIPIIAAGIYLLQKDKKEPPKPVEVKIRPVEKEEQPVQVSDSMVADSVVTDTAIIQPADTLKPEELITNFADYIEPDTTKFYVIGGSFENAENAEKYLQRMKKEGHTPFHLGKQGSFYLVGLEIHDNEIEAYGAQYNFLDKYPDSGVWVFIPE